MGNGGQAEISLMPDIVECMFSSLKAHNLKICMQGFFFFLVMKRRGKENPDSLSILHLTYVTKKNEVKVALRDGGSALLSNNEAIEGWVGDSEPLVLSSLPIALMQLLWLLSMTFHRSLITLENAFQ